MPEEEDFTNGGQNGSELNKDLNKELNQDIHNMPNNNGNSDINIKDNNSPEQQQNLIPNNNISNISNPSNEEIIQKINSFLQQKKFQELSSFLSLNKGKIPQNVLSSFISFVLESYNGDANIINLFLANGANVNSIIHNAECQIKEKEQINLLMFSIITNKMDLFKVVLKYNPDIFLEDKNKKNSLIYSILFNDDNNPFVLQELLKLNSDAINTIYNDQENNITHNLLTLAASKNKKNIVALLLENNCNINYQIPQTGDTAMHLTVKNDNVEIAEMIIKHPKYIKNIMNKLGETPKDIGKDKKGKIFYQIVAKEQQMNYNINNNNTNLSKPNNFGGMQFNNEINNMNNYNNIQINQNLMNIQYMNNNILGMSDKSKKSDKKVKMSNNNDLINMNMNLRNMDDNEYLYQGNNNQEDLIIPIQFQSVDYPTYLSMGQDIKLCINLFQNEDYLTQQIQQLEKELEEKKSSIEKYEELITEKERQKAEIIKNIKNEEENIKKQRKIKASQEKKITEIKAQNENYTKLLKQLKIISGVDEHEKNQNPATSIKELNPPENEKQNVSENLFSEEEFKFLEGKFHSHSYDHNYIVSCLQKDLKDYQAYVKEQISEKKSVIQEILQKLQLVVNEVNPNYKVNLYGSYCTGLCLPWSDIDTVITCESGHTDKYFLNRLYNKLSNMPWVKEHKFIENTNIPIIKLVSNDKFDFHIDISEESEKHFGLKTVELVKSYLNAYSVLEPIILALKTLLNNGNLNNPYTGGLSSYGLILMVVSFIQSEIDNDKYNEESPTILGETFLNVLGHYGIFFDYNNYVIITYLLDESNESSDRDNSFSFGPNSHELIIVDPLNKQNNVAKSTFQYMNIKMGFLIAFMVAKEDCECGCHYGCMQNKLDKTEHCILKRIFNSIKRFKDTNKNIY
jgi:non-canonical poly(A) RNA polymerase PAPD5/7